ncbi:MAG: CobW family GTP-binding protein [Acetobacteraceae bacterium]
MPEPGPDQRIPVVLLTGFLGSGKTTVLNAWLHDPALHDAAVIVNEFGEVGIDHALIASSNDNMIELSSGCLCCTVRGELVDTLRELVAARAGGEIRRFDRVVIETTGLADPAPVIQALMTFPVARTYRLGRVLTVVDGVQGMGTLDRHREAVKQAAVADELIVTKTDLETPDLEALTDRLRGFNPGAAQHLAAAGRVPPATLLRGFDIYDPANRTETVRAWLGAETASGHDHDHEHDPNRHDAEIQSFCLSFDTPLEWEHVAVWLDALVIAHGDDLLRVKGIIDVIGRDRPVVVQAVQRLFHPPAELPAWPAGKRNSQIVFITRGLAREFVAEVLETVRSRAPASAA